jgi:hypothetical protein
MGLGSPLDFTLGLPLHCLSCIKDWLWNGGSPVCIGGGLVGYR